MPGGPGCPGGPLMTSPRGPSQQAHRHPQTYITFSITRNEL